VSTNQSYKTVKKPVAYYLRFDPKTDTVAFAKIPLFKPKPRTKKQK